MQCIANIDFASLGDTLISLSAAVILGGLIGFERQVRQRTAGLRTNILVCLGAALFVDLAVRFYQLQGGSPSPLHVVAYVVSGVGFLGAGVIMRNQGNVRGLDTAATLWGSAAVGCAAGLDLLLEAVLGAAFILAANTFLRSITFQDKPRRAPGGTAAGAFYTFHLQTTREMTQLALAVLDEKFEEARLPLEEFRLKETGEREIDIEVILRPLTMDEHDLDQLAEKLSQAPYFFRVCWRLAGPA